MATRYRSRRRAHDAPGGRPRARHLATRRRLGRHGRVGVLALAMAMTVLAGAAAVGVLPALPGDEPAAAGIEAAAFATAELPAVDPVGPAAVAAPGTDPVATAAADPAALPADSGHGHRVVFSQSAQRVWLVGADGDVRRSYLVSGSEHDNLRPGTFAVFTRARQATAYDYASRLAYFVGFFRGQNAVIGFHDIPVGNDGRLLQTTAQLGTPLSSGCVRQDRPDAIALWKFAPVGTTVVVVA